MAQITELHPVVSKPTWFSQVIGMLRAEDG
jgi:hypothetical protein